MALTKLLAVAVASTLSVGTGAALTLPSGQDGGRSVESAAATGASRPLGRGGIAEPGARRAVAVSSGPFAAGSALSRPATRSPVAGGPDGAETASYDLSQGWRASSKQAPTGQTSLPTPAAGSLPEVPPLGRATSPDAVVMLEAPLTAGQRSALSALHGIDALDTVDTGTVDMGGAAVVAFGVDPGAFRSFTPAASAGSDQLWRYLAGGSLVASYEMATDRGLQLGSTHSLTTSSGASVRGWLGAVAAIGLPGVDLLVSRSYSALLGLTPDSGLVVSAPSLGGHALEQALHSVLPGAAVELLEPDQLPATLPGSPIASSVRQRIVSAALSRKGMPYVWGAAGPGSFDCSGLVQWAYRQAGIAMPRVAAEQYLTGDHIPLSQAQPGDLLFWTYDPSDPGYVDHVAIYLGNDQMVVAPHSGTDVQVSPVPTAEFAGAVAVVAKGR